MALVLHSRNFTLVYNNRKYNNYILHHVRILNSKQTKLCGKAKKPTWKQTIRHNNNRMTDLMKWLTKLLINSLQRESARSIRLWPAAQIGVQISSITSWNNCFAMSWIISFMTSLLICIKHITSQCNTTASRSALLNVKCATDLTGPKWHSTLLQYLLHFY